MSDPIDIPSFDSLPPVLKKKCKGCNCNRLVSDFGSAFSSCVFCRIQSYRSYYKRREHILIKNRTKYHERKNAHNSTVSSDPLLPILELPEEPISPPPQTQCPENEN